MPLKAVEPATTGGAHLGGGEGASSVMGRVRALFTGEALANGAVVVALVVGFFHGWLKLRFRHPATTFAFDIFLILALVIVFFRIRSVKAFFPPGRVTQALFAFYGLCGVYLVVAAVAPGMPPFVVALSTLRGWVFATFLYGLGYHAIRSRGQLHAYYLLIIGLALLTALYGIGQSDQEVRDMIENDPYVAEHRMGSGYYDSESNFHVRRFSTFISAGAFGGTMATVEVIAVTVLLGRVTVGIERWFVMGALVPIGYGMMLSGSRSPVIAVAFGIVLLAWFRRRMGMVLGIGLGLGVGAAAFLAAATTGGGLWDRLASVDVNSVYYRYYFPTVMGWDFMLSHPLGGGLGKTGLRPAFLWNVGYWDWVSPDGDLGRLMVEFGILGLIVYGRLIYVLAHRMLELVRATTGTLSGELVLAAAVNMWMVILLIPIGTPFAGIPLGVLVWFFVGAAERLLVIEQAVKAEGALRAGETGMVATTGTRGTAMPARSPAVDKRFLFARGSAREGSGDAARTRARDDGLSSGAGLAPASRFEPSAAEDVRPATRSRKVFLFAEPRKSERREPGADGSDRSSMRRR